MSYYMLLKYSAYSIKYPTNVIYNKAFSYQMSHVRHYMYNNHGPNHHTSAHYRRLDDEEHDSHFYSHERFMVAKAVKMKGDYIRKFATIEAKPGYASISECPKITQLHREHKDVQKVTAMQLLNAGVYNAIPFVGFGFLDNFIMIVAGDYIDHMFGAMFCISTMAAAALGNTLSDVAGMGLATYVEKVTEVMGYTGPKLSETQKHQTIVKTVSTLGRVIGIIIGCLLGMFPLMFMKEETIDAPECQTDISADAIEENEGKRKKRIFALPKIIIDLIDKIKRKPHTG